MQTPGGKRWDALIPRATAGVLGVLAGLDILLAIQLATGAVPWDVKGHLLEGRQLALFTGIIGGIGILGVAAAVAIWLGRHSGRVAAVSFWVVVGLVAAVTDLSYPGPGAPAWWYFLYLTLLPGGTTAALLWLPRPSRRFFGA